MSSLEEQTESLLVADSLLTEIPPFAGSAQRPQLNVHVPQTWRRERGIPPRSPSQRSFPAPLRDSNSLPAHGVMVSNFSGLRLLRKLKAEYLDERKLIQHDIACDENGAAGTSVTGEWLKFIKGARERSQAEADRAYHMFCHVMHLDLAKHVASFIAGGEDSFSDHAATTMGSDYVPSGEWMQDDRDDVFPVDDYATFRIVLHARGVDATFRDTFNEDDVFRSWYSRHTDATSNVDSTDSDGLNDLGRLSGESRVEMLQA